MTHCTTIQFPIVFLASLLVCACSGTKHTPPNAEEDTRLDVGNKVDASVQSPPSVTVGTQRETDLDTAIDASVDSSDKVFDDPAEACAWNLIRRISLNEKVLQLGHQSPGILNWIDEYNWWNEALHGVARSGLATVFPQAIALASTWDPDLIFEVATVISTEARIKTNTEGKGLTYWSPVVNLARDPRWGRNEESYGEDPYLQSRIAVAFVRGLQGDDPTYLKTVATPKHFIANNYEAGRHTHSSDLDERELREYYMPAFQASVVEGSAQSIMCAYNALNGVPSCANSWLLDDVLRKEWGFDGYVVSDCSAINDIYSGHEYAQSDQEASVMGLKAGCDLNCGSRFQTHLLDAVKQGEIAEDDIDRALLRLLKARCRLGEFDDPSLVPYNHIDETLLDSPVHSDLALETARKSMVLLKNNGILPLDVEQIDRIAVIGPNGDKVVFGGYSGEASNPVTPFAGIRERVEDHGVEVVFELGTELLFYNAAGIEAAAEAARIADVAIVVVGTDLSVANEELDRESLALPGLQDNLVESVFAANPNTIVVLVTATPLAVNWCDDNVPAILNAWYGGQAAGTAIAEILFGDTNPSGHLPQTFYRSEDDLPSMESYSLIEGKRTYMYFEGDVLYPFGHGLSYTAFDYNNLTLTPSDGAADTTVTVEFDVTNIGERAGEEVVQLYVRNVESPLPMPIKQLRRFKRISLASGESQFVTISLDSRDFSHYDTEKGAFVVEAGNFEIMVGASSADIRLRGVVTLDSSTNQ